MQAGLSARVVAPGGGALDRRPPLPSSSSPPSSARRAAATARSRRRRPPAATARRRPVCRAAASPPPPPPPPSGRRAALAGCCCAGCLALLLRTPGAGQAGAPPGAAAAAGGLAARPRGGAYDEYFAAAMGGMDVYETEVASLKKRLFKQLATELVSSRGGQGGSSGSSESAGGSGSSSASSAASPRPISVLELGVGRGPNFALLASAFEEAGADVSAGELRVTGVDPNPAMLPYAHESASAAGLPAAGVALEPLYVEQLSGRFGEGAFDAAVVTLVLCSVPDAQRALAELRRVVRRGGAGRLLLIEHVADPRSRSLRRLGQSVLNPLQRALADGCNLTRDTEGELRRAGFFGGRGGEGGGGGGGAGEDKNAGRLERLEIAGLGLLAPHIVGVLEI